MRGIIIRMLDDIQNQPRNLKATAWLLHDAFFACAGFNQVTGLIIEACLYAAVALALVAGCRIYGKSSDSFAGKTYATLMACALLATVAYQLLASVAGTQVLTAPQAWAVILYMTPLAVNRFNADHTLKLLHDFKQPPDQRRPARAKSNV